MAAIAHVPPSIADEPIARALSLAEEALAVLDAADIDFRSRAHLQGAVDSLKKSVLEGSHSSFARD
jgi:hypothetical protein